MVCICKKRAPSAKPRKCSGFEAYIVSKKYRLETYHELLRGLENPWGKLKVFEPKWNEGWLLTYLEHEITSSVHVILVLLDLPFVLGGAVVWTASFLAYLAIGIFLLWLVQVIYITSFPFVPLAVVCKAIILLYICCAQSVDRRFAQTIHGLSQAQHDQLKRGGAV